LVKGEGEGEKCKKSLLVRGLSTRMCGNKGACVPEGAKQTLTLPKGFPLLQMNKGGSSGPESPRGGKGGNSGQIRIKEGLEPDLSVNSAIKPSERESESGKWPFLGGAVVPVGRKNWGKMG